jgi:hypothetical protein
VAASFFPLGGGFLEVSGTGEHNQAATTCCCGSESMTSAGYFRDLLAQAVHNSRHRPGFTDPATACQWGHEGLTLSESGVERLASA